MRSLCPDGSDVRHCLHKIYTGCFLDDEDGLGIRMADCDECFCELREEEEEEDDDDGSNSSSLGSYRRLGATADTTRRFV